MKTYFKKIAALAAVSFSLGLQPAGANEPGNAYGILAFSNDQPGLANHLVSFPIEGEGNPVYTSVVGFGETSTAGAYGTDAYWLAATRLDGTREVADALYRLDIKKGTYSRVGSLTGFYSLINDMTFDHSSGTMYAISRVDETYSALYVINLNDASSRKIATLDRKFFTLAASWGGELYGISFSGDLCRIGKTDGKVEVIGSTGLYPEKFQSMEFDHQSKKLWWCATVRTLSESGMIEVQETFMATVDPATGAVTRGRKMGDDQIAGLYVPYIVVPDAAPMQVENLSVTPEAGGVYAAVLSWTNPSLTFSGDPVKELTKVEIYRDGVFVGSVPSPRSGSVSTFRDVIAAQGGAHHTYTVVASTAAGAGIPAEASSFVGTDIPAAVGNVAVERLSANSALISWDPVKTGVNGGWIDTSSLAYKVVRNPGEEVVAASLQTTQWTETGVSESGNYTYTITAFNKDGVSAPVVSEGITLGPKLEFPHTDNFTEDEFAKWTVIDSNNDGNKWQWFNLSWAKADGAYFMATPSAGDDWLVSHPFEFDGNSTYKITFTYIANGTHRIETSLLKDYALSTPVKTFAPVEFGKGFSLTTKEMTFDVADAGEYNLAFHEISEAGNSYLLIDKIVIEKLVDNNLAAVNIAGNAKPNDGNAYPYGVTIENRGRKSRAGFSVEVLDQNNAVVGTTLVNDTIESGSSAVIYVKVTAREGILSLRGRVNDSADEIASDNLTSQLEITVMPQGTPEAIVIGEKKGTTRDHPFNLAKKYSMSQQIYSRDEIGVEKGRVFAIHYPYSASKYSVAPTGVAMKVYLANTDRSVADGGWIPQSDMTLVYDGVVDMNQGDGILELPLDEAFNYDGRNLAVVTYHSLENAGQSYYSSVYWNYYNSPVSGNAPYDYSSDQPFEYGSAEGKASTYYGNTVATFMFQTGGATIGGTVSDAKGNPVDGATVRIEAIKASANTDESGTYSFDFVPNGSYTLTASKLGYEPAESAEITVADRSVVVDMAIRELPTASVRGKVVSPDGVAVEGVSVALDGYTALETTTDSKGEFSFPKVVCQESSLTLAKDWFAPKNHKFEFDADIDLGNVTIGYAHYTPGNVDCTADETGAVRIGWTAPDVRTLHRFDNGNVATQFGLSNQIGTAVMGTAFRTPMVVDTIRWQTTYEGGPHNIVNIYVYDLDEKGMPTGRLLFSERSVWNTDGEWSSFGPSEPIVAPNGCLVTINYPGFLALAIDDASRQYPYNRNTYYFSTDFNSGEFLEMEALGLNGNPLIRVEGYDFPAENDPVASVGDNRSELPEWYSYKVWRSEDKAEGEPDWKLLTSSPQSATSFVDPEWNTLPAGVYRYAVSSSYPDGSVSALACSPRILRNVYSTLTVEAATNSHSGRATGAKVILDSEDKSASYTAEIGADGKAVIEGMWKDRYSLTLSLDGYEDVVTTVDITSGDEVKTPLLTMKEIIATPVNVRLFNDDEGLMLTWNESGEIFDGFENYETFAAPEGGEIRWKCIDGDGARTFAEQDFDFPGRTQPMSFIVFDPKKTTPSMFEQRSASHPYSGDSHLACFASRSGNDDWLISPRLIYHNDFKFSFYAKGYSATYGETIKVGYSTTGNSPEDFKWIGDEYDVIRQQWNQFKFTIPAGARYVAIRSTSLDGFTLFIDDVEIGSGLGMPMNTALSGPEVAYEISLDGKVISTTDATSLLLPAEAKEASKAYIRAVYASGKSEPAVVDINGSGVSGVFDGEPVSVRWFTPEGLEISEPAKGMLLIKISTDSRGNSKTEKIMYN